jgi:hypothetical protein
MAFIVFELIQEPLALIFFYKKSPCHAIVARGFFYSTHT